VTLKTKRGGELRGCIGSIMPTQPLYLTVLDKAKAAAFHDTRFAPLTHSELDKVVIDITMLAPPHRVGSYKDIVLGRDGIILEKHGRSAVFLPHVPTEFGWTLPATLQQLSMKAGLAKDAWQHGATYEVFEGFEFKER